MLPLVAKLRNCEIKKFIPIFFFLFLIALIFRSWFFSFAPLTSGDLSFSFEESAKELTLQNFLWAGKYNLGGISLYGWMAPYSVITAAFAYFFNIPSSILVRIFWFWPFLALSAFSSFYLFKTAFSGYMAIWLYGYMVYITNTYILMILHGGQITIAMAYAIAPLVLGRIINQLTSWRVGELTSLILTGLILAVQVMFDPRIAYVTLLACGLYWIINGLTSYKRKNGYMAVWLYGCKIIKDLFLLFVIPGLIVALLHSYWILPMVMNKSIGLENLGEAYTTVKAVKYFSFAQFSNTVSLLHPNWPENIFGKVYFMRAEFLILPILAFSSLLFINKNGHMAGRLDGQQKNSPGVKLPNKKSNNLAIQPSVHITIPFFSLLGLLGAFLAKGANPPLGEVYLWLFQYFPGMIMFRDPTKFYLLVCLSYSVLIPFSVLRIYELLKRWLNRRRNGYMVG